MKWIINDGKLNNEFKQELRAEELAFYIIASIEGSIALAKTFKKKHILNSNMRLLKKYLQESV
jgi:hypothetical protein